MTIVKYLDPKNDVVFKKIFGTEKNKDILIHFLNDVLSKAKTDPIQEVTLLNPSQLPEIKSQKQSAVDVLCKDERGAQYIVEMQVAQVGGFEKRAQYYAAKAYSNQAVPGEHAYKNLKEIIFLAITEFVMFPKKPGYKSEHVLLDHKSFEHDLKDFSFTFIELPKFTRSIDELKTFEHKWCYFFKHAKSPDDIEKLLEMNDEVIKKACRVLETHNWTTQELRNYEAAQKIAWDSMARENYVLEKGIEQGLKKGREEGREEGRAEERAKHKAEKIEIAKRLLASNVPAEKVAEMLELDAKELIE